MTKNDRENMDSPDIWMCRSKADRFLEFVYTRLFERSAKGLLWQQSLTNEQREAVRRLATQLKVE